MNQRFILESTLFAGLSHVFFFTLFLRWPLTSTLCFMIDCPIPFFFLQTYAVNSEKISWQKNKQLSTSVYILIHYFFFTK